MILWLVPYAPYFHNFEAAPVYTQDVCTFCPYHYNLSHPIPRLHVLEPPALPELVEEVYQTKLHQKVINLLDTRVLGLTGVGAEVPEHYGILVPEVCQGLLHIQQVLQCGGRKIFANKKNYKRR